MNRCLTEKVRESLLLDQKKYLAFEEHTLIPAISCMDSLISIFFNLMPYWKKAFLFNLQFTIHLKKKQNKCVIIVLAKVLKKFLKWYSCFFLFFLNLNSMCY